MMHAAEPVARPQGTLWMLDLGQPLPVGPTPRAPVAFTRAGLEMAEELARAMGLDDQAVVQRFDNGRHCYVGRSEGRLATYGWVTFDEEDISELGLSIRRSYTKEGALALVAALAGHYQVTRAGE